MRDATVSALQMAVTLNRPGGEKAPAEMSLLAVLIGPLAEALSNTVGETCHNSEMFLDDILTLLTSTPHPHIIHAVCTGHCTTTQTSSSIAATGLVRKYATLIK